MPDATPSHADLDPSTYAVVFSTARILRRAIGDSSGMSLTEYRILSYVVSNEKALGSAIAPALDLHRSAVSMGLALLGERELVERRGEGGRAFIAPTQEGWREYHLAHEAIRSAVEGDLPVLFVSERKTIGHYLVMMADRLGASIMNNSEVDMVHLMVETNTRVKSILRRSAANGGLSSNGFLILSALTSKASEEARPSELAECTRLGKSDVARTCRELERNGCILRAGDPQDNRGKIVSCTPEGRRMFESAAQAFWDEFSTKVRNLNSEEFAFFTDINTRRR